MNHLGWKYIWVGEHVDEDSAASSGQENAMDGQSHVDQSGSDSEWSSTDDDATIEHHVIHEAQSQDNQGIMEDTMQTVPPAVTLSEFW